MGNFLDKLTALPKYQVVIIAILPFAAAIAASFMLLIQPTMEDLDRVNGDIKNLNNKLATDRNIAAQLPKFKKEFENLQAKLEESLRQLPEQKEIPNLLTSIATLAKEKNLEIIKFKPGAEVAREFYADVPVSLKVYGGFHDLVLFFEAVGDLERIVNIGGLKVTKAGNKGKKDSLSVDFLATTFRFLDKKGGK